MLLGFISLLLTATSSTIANICVPSSFYNDRFVPCTRSEIREEELGNESSVQRNLLTKSFFFSIFKRRRLEGIHQATCSEVVPLIFRHLESAVHFWGLVYSIFAGAWAVCFIRRPWTVASLYLYNGGYTCYLQLLDHAPCYR